MMVFRVIIFITLVSIVSWVILKMLNKPVHIGALFLGWLLVFFVVMGGFYGVSILVANSNNM